MAGRFIITEPPGRFPPFPSSQRLRHMEGGPVLHRCPGEAHGGGGDTGSRSWPSCRVVAKCHNPWAGVPSHRPQAPFLAIGCISAYRGSRLGTPVDTRPAGGLQTLPGRPSGAAGAAQSHTRRPGLQAEPPSLKPAQRSPVTCQGGQAGADRRVPAMGSVSRRPPAVAARTSEGHSWGHAF